MIYLDEAATTKPKKEVLDTIYSYMDMWYNPSSLYSPAQEAANALKSAKETVAHFLNSEMYEVYFTSCGSESNCWAIQGFVQNRLRKGRIPSVITSVIEHKSILSCVDGIGVDVHFIDVDTNGCIDLRALEDTLKYVISQKSGEDILVSIQYANNEIGTIQHIHDIALTVHKYGAIFHTDAVQAFGHIPIDVKASKIDMLSASGHKIGTPKGIGILYKKEDVKISPLIYGSQMNGLRGGTENLPYIMGFAKAVELCSVDMKQKKYLTTIKQRDYMIGELLDKIDCKLNGQYTDRLPNNINITFNQNVMGEAMIYLLDLCDIYVSAGSACNSHSSVPSHVLKAIGLSDEEAVKSLRITLPDNITTDITDKVIHEMQKQIQLLIE